MKKLLTFCLSLFVCSGIASAQTTLYSQNFNSTYTDWSLNTSDLSGVTSMTPNYWTVTNVYAGSIIAPTTTPDEPSGIVGYPESEYLHIRSAVGPANATFNASGNHNYTASLNTPIVTTGNTGVTLTFWWLCKGDNVSYGRVYFRTNSSSTAWQQISTMSAPPASLDSYNNQGSSWIQQSIHLDSFDNQPFLEFAFLFHHQGAAGSDPSFAVDDIIVTGTATSSAPVASFTTTATTICQDSCITFTSTTSGPLPTLTWNVMPSGPVIADGSGNATLICFPGSGSYTVSLTATNSGGSNTATSVINVTPTPHPTITKTGHTLSVSGSYTGYQWYDAATAIMGATNASYTYTVGGTYSVEVDSAGCPGFSNVENTTGIINVANTATNYWMSQTNNSNLSLNASVAPDDALAITIYDATGRKVLDDIWNAGSYTKQINGLSMPSGLYIIKLSNHYTSAVMKWLKP